MKNLPLVACLIVLAAALSPGTPTVSAQRQANQERTPQVERPRQGNPRANPDDGFSRRGRAKGRALGDDERPRRGIRRALGNPGERRKMQEQIMRAIGLRPDQVARMNEIRRGFDDEIIASGRRIRETRRALDRVIMSERFDQESFDRHAEEYAKAQADNVRLQARIRAQIRGVLTPEQVIRFNELERKLRRERRDEKAGDQ
jgi:Spy/CpxP family protein refolding chaperone